MDFELPANYEAERIVMGDKENGWVSRALEGVNNAE